MVPRRALLRVLGMSVAGGLAGCNAITDGDPATSPTQQRTPTTTPTTTLTPTPTNPPPASSTGTETTTTTPVPTPTPALAETRRTPGLTAADTEVTEFGQAVALSTDTAIVLAEKDGAFVFERDDGWSQTTVLRTDDRENFGAFNLSAALVGKVAMIGGPDAGPEAGKGTVYLYERIGEEWRQRHRFTAVDEDRDEFGRAVDYDGDRLVVGDANEPTTMVSWIGNAYVFAGDGTNWTREAKIGTGDQDLFGTAVTVDGDDVLVGAPRAEPSENQVGAVYAYRRDESDWQRDSMLTPADSGEGDLFGQAVDIDGDTAVIGAPGSESAYIFERAGSEWQRRARLESPDDGGRFGQAVRVLDRTVVVGAPKEGSGRVYVFPPADDWARPRRLLDPGLPEEAQFGAAIDAADATALVGAPIYNATSGAYLFDF